LLLCGIKKSEIVDAGISSPAFIGFAKIGYDDGRKERQAAKHDGNR